MAGQDNGAAHKKPAHDTATHNGSANTGGAQAPDGGTAAPMDSRAIALGIASQLVEYRNRLAGKADDAQRAQTVLATVGKNVDEYHSTHAKNASSLTGHWSGTAADKFHTRAKKVNASLATTSASTTKAAGIVQGVSEHLTTGHNNVTGEIDAYLREAVPLIDGAKAAQGAGSRAAVVQAVGKVVDSVRTHTATARGHYTKVGTEMTHAAKQLQALKKDVEHDGYADPKKAQHKAPAKVHKHEPPKVHKGGKTHPSTKGKDIVNRARKELGYTEHPLGSNVQKYGPTEYWCSLFATWVWRHAGVNIPSYAFTGDVYTWGQQHHLAYDKHHLDQVKPGDVLLFGTGPQNTTTSTHIGIVESVDGNTVHTIEGNEGNAVRRETHTLSSSTFYGGVHPS